MRFVSTDVVCFCAVWSRFLSLGTGGSSFSSEHASSHALCCSGCMAGGKFMSCVSSKKCLAIAAASLRSGDRDDSQSVGSRSVSLAWAVRGVAVDLAVSMMEARKAMGAMSPNETRPPPPDV